MASLEDERSSEISNLHDTPMCNISSLSPMTDLAENLSSLSTSGKTHTPRRRILWGYPSPNEPVLNAEHSNFLCGVSASASPLFQVRLPKYDKIVHNRLGHKSFLRSRTLPIFPLISKDKENVQPSVLASNASGGFQNNKPFDIGSDSDSQDSGYSGSINQKCQDASYQFSGSTIQSSGFRDEESEDGFLGIFEMDILNENESLPSSMTSLLTKPLSDSSLNSEVSTESENYIRRRKCIRRSLSMTPKKSVASQYSSTEINDDNCERQHNVFSYNGGNTMACTSSEIASVEFSVCSKEKNDLETFPDKHSFKRPEPPKDIISPLQNKRRKSTPVISFLTELQLGVAKRAILKRSFSETEAIIMKAVQKSDQQPDLIGDFSKPYVLPLIKGKHQDLKTISTKTLADLINGEYRNSVKHYIVIDCRYPYEYNGGHIKNARNIYTKEDVVKDILPGESELVQDQRNILIFHCEFSSERAPNLCRFLRNKDRETNKDSYPLLHHPEIYVLDGGYKAFYEKFKELCEPQYYLPMRHKDHEFDFRHFRAKSKSWSGDQKNRVHVRSGFKF